MSESLVRQGVCKTLASACEVRFLGGVQSRWCKTAKVASLLSLMTPNAGALGPMIPAMEHRVFSVLTIAVVAGVALLVVLYGLSAVLMLIAGYLPD